MQLEPAIGAFRVSAEIERKEHVEKCVVGVDAFSTDVDINSIRTKSIKHSLHYIPR